MARLFTKNVAKC